jgi:hypothetical protein
MKLNVLKVLKEQIEKNKKRLEAIKDATGIKEMEFYLYEEHSYNAEWYITFNNGKRINFSGNSCGFIKQAIIKEIETLETELRVLENNE